MMQTIVQLGWLQDAIDWLFNKILSPIFNWLADLLSTVFEWVFNNILLPILQVLFEKLLKIAIQLIWKILATFLYTILKGLLSIVEMLEESFSVLAGTKEVTVSGAKGPLLTVLVNSGFVRNTIMITILIAFILCFLFAVFGVLRSIADMEGQQNRPVGQVLRLTLQAVIRMLLVPVMALMLIMLGDAILKSIQLAMNPGGSSIARTIFVIGSLDAVSERSEGAKDKDGVKVSKDGVLGYNSSTRQQYLANHKGEAKDYGLEDKFRQPFYTGTKDYKDTTTVRETFDLTRYNFIVGFLGALLFLMILGGAMFTFTSRLFDVIILLIIEPLFIAPMPLDDGEHFQKWMEMFLGKLFSGYGMVVAMNLYLIISARVFDGKLVFFKPGASEMDMFTPLGGGDELMDLLMKTIFLIGGGMAMMSAGPLVTQILSAAAGSEEAAASGAGMSVVGAAERVAGSGVKWAGKKVGGAIGSKLGSVFNGGGNDGEAEGDKGDKDKKSDAAFDGKKSESKKEGATPSTGSNLNKKTGSGVDGKTTNMYDFFGVDKPQSSSGSGGGSGVDGKTTNMYDFFGVPRPAGSSSGSGSDGSGSGSGSGSSSSGSGNNSQGGGDVVNQAVNNNGGGGGDIVDQAVNNNGGGGGDIVNQAVNNNGGGGDIVDQAVNNQIGGQNSGQNEGNAFGGSQDGGAGSNNNSGSNKQSTSMYDFFNVPRPDNGGNQDNKDGDNQFNGKK